MRVLFLLLFASFLSLNVLGQRAISPTTGCQPFTVDFEAPSTSATYYWDFGDGVPSIEKNPSNSYGKAGVFFVKFRESANGPVIGDPIKITVYEQPKLSYSVEPAFSCPFVDLKFTSTSIIDPGVKVNAFRWVFGDGFGIEGPTDSARHAYNKVGEYNIFLELKTDYPACNKTLQFSETVKVLKTPVTNFETNPPVPNSCEPSLTVAFKNTTLGDAALKYAWDLGNGVKSSDINAPTQNYSSGQYHATLKSTYQGVPGCSSSAGIGISVGKPTADIIVEKDTLCLGAQSYVKTKGIGLYSWEFDYGTIYDGNRVTKDSTSIAFLTPGEHTVKLTVSSFNGICWDTKIKKIYVEELKPKIESSPSFSCSSPMNIQYKATVNASNVSYAWNFSGDPNTYKTATVNHKYLSKTAPIYYGVNDFESQIATLTVTSNISGCKGTAVKMDTMWLPNARFMPSITKGCAPLTVTFSDSSKTFAKNPIVSWKWLFGDKNASVVKADSNDVSFTYSTPGEYYARLVVTTKGGCVDTSFAVLIEVGDKIESQVAFESDKSSVCPGEPVTFKVTQAPSFADAFHFNTEENRMFHCSDQKTASWSYNNVVGPQSVSLTVDYNGCFSEITKPALVTVKGAIAKIDYSAFCSDPYVYNFESKSLNASKVSWDFGDKTAVSAAVSESHDFQKSGDFVVRLTAESNECPSTIDEVTVHPRKVKAKITLTDSLMCIMTQVNFSAANSEDVYANCRTGYTWEIPTMKEVRPMTGSSSSTSFLTVFKGEHTLKLTVQDINGCKNTDSTRIKIYDMTVAAKPNRAQICLPTQPGAIKFADISTADTLIKKWEWNFGDGLKTEYKTFVDSVSHDYSYDPLVSSFPYSLKITDTLGCEETFVGVLPVYKPVTKINTDTTLCVGETVKILAPDFTTAGSFLKYDWNFGNNTTSAVGENDIVYETEGKFWVKLKYEEAISQCKGRDSVLMSVQGYPKAKFVTPKMNSYAVICADINPDIVNLSYPSNALNSPIVSTVWEGRAENYNQETAYDRVPDWSFPIGLNKIKLTVTTKNGCSSDTTGEFRAWNAEGNFVKTKDTICLDDEVEFYLIDTVDVKRWEWTFEGILIENKDSVFHRFKAHPEGENAIAKLKLESNRGGCFRLFEQKIYIHPVIADFSRESEPSDTSICFNEGPFHLSDKSTNSNFFKWNFGDNSPDDSTTVAPAHKYAVPGKYNVTLTVQNYKYGCVDTLTKVAVVYPNPKVVASGDTMCFGSNKKLALNVLNPVSTSKYLWTPADGLDNQTIPNTIAAPDQTTLYRVVETDTVSGCTDFTEVTGLVVKRIGLEDWDTTIVIGDIATLPLYGDPVYKFKWTPEKYLSCTDCFYPKAQPLEDIVYNLLVTDVYGCFIDPFKYEITVKPETFVKLPSAFTPNGDSKNDKVYIKGWGIKKLIEYKVFNRWGQEIFSTDDINEGWDGTFKGQKQNSDLYVYKVKVMTWKEEEKYVEGYINLLY